MEAQISGFSRDKLSRAAIRGCTTRKIRLLGKSKERLGAAAGRLDPEKLARFGQLMRANITDGEVPFCKAYLRSLIDAVEVDQHIVRITDQGRCWRELYSPNKPPSRVLAVLYGSGAPTKVKLRTPIFLIFH